MFRTVDMAAELTAFFTQFADASQREDLKTARVGQNRTVPGIKLMQASRLTQDIQSRTQVEVIGVAQDDLRLHLLAEFGEVNTLHAAHRTHRHEYRCLYLPVIGGDHSRSRVTRLVAILYFEFHKLSTLNSQLSILFLLLGDREV